MDTSQALSNIGQLLVNVVWALVILFVGWIVAKIVAALVGKLVHWLKLDERIGKAAGANKVPRLENIIIKAAYYLILLFAVVAALNALGLTMVTQPLNALLNAIFAYIPSLIAGGVVVFIAWLVATILRAIVRGFLESTKMDKKVAKPPTCRNGRWRAPSVKWPTGWSGCYSCLSSLRPSGWNL